MPLSTSKVRIKLVLALVAGWMTVKGFKKGYDVVSVINDMNEFKQQSLVVSKKAKISQWKTRKKEVALYLKLQTMVCVFPPNPNCKPQSNQTTQDSLRKCQAMAWYCLLIIFYFHSITVCLLLSV